MKIITLSKQLLFITSILYCFSLTSQAQGYVALENISEFVQFNNSALTTIIVKDSLRGGTFFQYNGADPVDNGMIFKDALNRKWLRQTSGEIVNVQWYGARSAQSIKDVENDLYPKLMAALNYVWQHNNFTTVRIPNDRKYKNGYFCLSTVHLKRSINIIGDGVNTLPLTRINFPPNKKGFTTTYATPEGSRNAVKLKNLWLNGGTTENFDSSAHMITPKGFIEVSQCVIEYTGGNGIHLEACYDKKSPINGNVDGSIIEDVEFAFCNNGIYINGCDANIIKMKRNFYTNMRRWGQYNNGFLGSQETDAHYSVNGYNTNCVVRYAGKNYAAINTDYYLNIGKRPDKEPDFWEEIADTTINTLWNPTKKYWSGGAYFASNDNGFSKYDYNYTEGNQAPARVNNKTLVIGGDNGAGVKGGVFLEASNGQFVVRNSGMWLKDGNLSIGKQDDNARLRIHQKTTGEPGIWISSDLSKATSLRFTNKTSTQAAEIYYNNNDFEFTTQNIPRTVLNETGFWPFSNNSYDLGLAAKKWKNVYAVNYYGDGSNLTGLPASLWKAGNNGSIFNTNINNIGINNSTPHQSAVLDVGSNNKGFLPPRMSSAEKKSIKNPAEGLIVYDLTLHKLCVFNGTKWETITSL